MHLWVNACCFFEEARLRCDCSAPGEAFLFCSTMMFSSSKVIVAFEARNLFLAGTTWFWFCGLGWIGLGSNLRWLERLEWLGRLLSFCALDGLWPPLLNCDPLYWAEDGRELLCFVSSILVLVWFLVSYFLSCTFGSATVAVGLVLVSPMYGLS